MQNRAARIVAAAPLIAIILVACGGDPLTKEEFITQADAICAAAEEEIADLERPTNPDQIDDFVERARELTENTLEQLRELEPPEADAEELERMLDAIQRAVDQLPDLAEAAKTNDTQAIADASREVQEATETSREIASEYGFEKCGGVAPTGPTGG